MPKVIISGCGFLGETAADLFSGSGWQVLGLCATPASASRLAGKPYPVLGVDISHPVTLPKEWHGADGLVHCASSGRGGPDAYRAVYRDGMEHLLSAIQPRRALFTGSTSVYAQTDGSWVTEDSPAEPERETGRILLNAEAITLAASGYVLRLSGLYGPGRSVLVRKFLAGESRIEGDGRRWINQIHRDDAARAIFHLFQSEQPSGIYNASDNTPTTQAEIMQAMAAHFRRPLPPPGEPDLARKRGWTNKRVSNSRLRATGWLPDFPGFRDALPTLA